MSRLVYDSLEDYVQEMGGLRVIKRILIANNGNAAIKAIRSMRTWAHKTFGNEKELEFVVMATIEDIEANAEYVAEADYLQEVPSGTNNNNFANVSLVVQTAEEFNCDAVWPGWGHASENFELPLALEKARRPIQWIGPKPSSMLALGDKIGSTIIAQSAEVPCVPWSGSEVTLPTGFDCLESLPQNLLEAACVKSADDVKRVCDKIGYPVMVKASEGGGGKGIRKVLSEKDIPDAFRQVVNEVKGSPVFVMKMVSRCRHLEVQIFADEHGNAYSMGTRDCSIQRRSQKIIEEGNVVAAPPHIVKAMEDAAVRLAQKVGYTNCGTAEFLYDAETQEVYFCEVNARLQVEHVVTEVVDDINLPAAQLQVAMGIPIPSIPDVGRFLQQRANGTLAPRHCVACRITAEHAEEGFRPTSGAVHEISFRSSSKVWGYFCIGAPGRIHAYADSQFGHIFSVGDTREDAIANMLAALKSLVIRGEIRTNVEALMTILMSPDFLQLKTYTTWLEECLGFSTPLLSRRVQFSTLQAVILAATYEASEIFHASRLEFAQKMSQGQLPSGTVSQTSVELVYKGTKFSVDCRESGSNKVVLSLNGSSVECAYRHINSSTRDGGLLVSGGFDGRSRQVFRKREPQGVSVTFENATYSFTKEIDPTQVRAPMSGKLVRWLVDDGADCQAGTPYCEIEIMKMYMQLQLEHAGKISHVLSEGAVFVAGDLLASLELPNGAAPPKITPFAGQFPPVSASLETQSPLLERRQAEARLLDVVRGYAVPEQTLTEALQTFTASMLDTSIAPLEFREVISVLNSQLPEGLKKAMAEIIANDLSKPVSKDLSVSPLPVEKVRRSIEAQLSLQASGSYTGPTIQHAQLQPLLDLIHKYDGGVIGAAMLTIGSLLKEFVQDESVFAHSSESPFKILQTRRTELSNERAGDLLRAHLNLRIRSTLVCGLLDLVKSSKPLIALMTSESLQTTLTALAGFTKTSYTAIAARARQLQLLRISDMDETLASRMAAVEQDIRTTVLAPEIQSVPLAARISKFLQSRPRLASSEDALAALCSSTDKQVGGAALAALISFLFGSLDIQGMNVFAEGDKIETTSSQQQDASGIESLLKAAAAKSTSRVLSAGHAMLLATLTHRPAVDASLLASVMGLSTSAVSSSGAASKQTSLVGGTSPSDASASRLMQMLSADNDTLAPVVDEANRHGTTVLVFPTLAAAASSIAKCLDEVLQQISEAGLVAGVAAKNLLVLCPQATSEDQTQLTALKAALNTTALKSAGFSVVSIGHAAASARKPSATDDLVPLTFLNWRHLVLSTPVASSAATQGAVILDKTAASSDVVFVECPLVTNVDPAHIANLELPRLENFTLEAVPTAAPFVHILQATPKGAASDAAAAAGRRLFVRVLLRSSELKDVDRFSEQERFMCVAINSLESAVKACRVNAGEGNMILLSVLPTQGNSQFRYSPASAEQAIRAIYSRYEARLAKVRVSRVEIRYPWGTGAEVAAATSPVTSPANVGGASSAVMVRLVVDNPTGQSVRCRTYKEIRNPTTGAMVLSAVDRSSLEGANDELDNQRVMLPLAVASPLALKRAQAASVSTVYVYDFLPLLEQSLKDVWREFYGGSSASEAFLPERLVEATELVLNSRGLIEEVVRAPGQNTVGMVAWSLKIHTPEFPKGRRVVLIANDCTFQMGTFGVAEDLLYQRASELARREGVPRVFLACNSGARMGIASEILKHFHVEWVDPKDPARGFRYLYVLPAEYKTLCVEKEAIATEEITHPVHGTVYRITDVIGSEGGLGVENLCGSGAIAGETSRAYRETFTLTYVTGRNVGIGAYVTRLGQRVIQKVSDAPILLTGFQALNRLVGRDVYSSNDEIGGIDVMFRNGISHEIVRDDKAGCTAILKWLAFVPERRGGALPVLPSPSDPIGRQIAVKPTSSVTEDPRQLLTGSVDAQGHWNGGLLDRDSFSESLAEWAKATIVGRGRLGGYPIGVVMVETRVTEAKQPADPAAPQTSEQTQVRAGQVWYPDSAYKTAQAINDFNQEELPLLILANWRGFSGGQRDMFLEVLKFGSYIVDALVDFKQPCFVYIPPKGELRGGAWVCVDPRINPTNMEMYADTDARGGVLEPTGTVEIKLRERQLVELASRLDDKLQAIAQDDAALLAQGLPVDAPERLAVKEARDRRIAELLPVYKQVALHFADLHDTSVRMKRKNAIQDSVEWTSARSYFYWRLRRQLVLFSVRAELQKSVPSLAAAKADRLVNSWMEEDSANIADNTSSADASIEESIRFVQWAKANAVQIYQRIRGLRASYIRQQVADFLQEAPSAVWEALKELDPSRAQAAISSGEAAGLATLLHNLQ